MAKYPYETIKTTLSDGWYCLSSTTTFYFPRLNDYYILYFFVKDGEVCSLVGSPSYSGLIRNSAPLVNPTHTLEWFTSSHPNLLSYFEKARCNGDCPFYHTLLFDDSKIEMPERVIKSCRHTGQLIGKEKSIWLIDKYNGGMINQNEVNKLTEKVMSDVRRTTRAWPICGTTGKAATPGAKVDANNNEISIYWKCC